MSGHCCGEPGREWARRECARGAVITVPVAEWVKSENREAVVVTAGIPFFYPSIRSPDFRRVA